MRAGGAVSAHPEQSRRDSVSPLDLTEDGKIRTTNKTFIAIIVATISLSAAGVAGWMSVKGDNTTHTAQIAVLEQTLHKDHDTSVMHTVQIEGIAKTLERIEKKIDRIRMPAEVTTTTKTEVTSH